MIRADLYLSEMCMIYRELHPVLKLEASSRTQRFVRNWLAR